MKLSGGFFIEILLSGQSERRTNCMKEKEAKKKLEEMNLLDDFLFGSLVTYPEVGGAVCEESGQNHLYAPEYDPEQVLEKMEKP